MNFWRHIQDVTILPRDDEYEHVSVGPLIFETILFGFFSLLVFIVSLIIFRIGLRGRQNIILATMCLTMYGMAAAHWAMLLQDTIRINRDHHDAYHTRRTCAPSATLLVSIELGDALVLWRAWVLWPRNRTMQVFSVLVLITSFSIILSWITSLWSTIFILVKAAQHKYDVRSHLQIGGTRKQVEKALALIIDSGIAYCIIWTLMVVYDIASGAPLFETVVAYDPVAGDLDLPLEQFVNVVANYFIDAGLIQIIGIHCSVLIALVCLEGSQCSRTALTLQALTQDKLSVGIQSAVAGDMKTVENIPTSPLVVPPKDDVDSRDEPTRELRV